MNAGDERIVHVNIGRVNSGTMMETEDVLAVEEPLEIQLQYHNGKEVTKSVAVTMRTPGNDYELATGFLFTEGIIIENTSIDGHDLDATANTIRVKLKEGITPNLKKAERNFYTTSSCGVCGKASIDAITSISTFDIRGMDMQIDSPLLARIEKKLINHQTVFSKTGGLHASALFDQYGDLLFVREDVGRHNALDKLIGVAFLNHTLPLSNTILLLSGRASFELIQKASVAGIPIVASIGAPSSLAVSLAQEAGITLIGFLRNDRFNIYSHSSRIIVSTHSAVLK